MNLQDRIARVLVVADTGLMVLLHGFIKKTQKTLPDDLDLARKRACDIQPLLLQDWKWR